MFVGTALPTGTVTFLFTDIEGSTKLVRSLGDAEFSRVLTEHREGMRRVFADFGGVEVGTEGDSFFVAFDTATAAVDAALEAQKTLESGGMKVRMGLHTGAPQVVDGDYVGVDVHMAARIAAAAHGGQVLLSAATRGMVSLDVLDLGLHVLKDFDEPVSVYQLGARQFPPLRTVANTNLPKPASSFVGRDREISELTGMVADGVRILTLTGPGGSGKTRLGIETASRVVPVFGAGVFWVGLASLRDAALVSASIAQTIGARGELATHIGDRSMLLVLDNLEQVIDASSDLADLVEACPNLKLLVTSREVLRVRGEVEYPVLPLQREEAVELFTARSRIAADADVARLCAALDDLPLAVELAAARARLMSPAQILSRLSDRLDSLKGGRDADPRQQTLRAAIEWSHDLLADDEKTLFARLGVFRGGASLEAAESVVAAEADLLGSLLDKSLVRRTGDRYWMLETIRQFALERLYASGEAEELRRNHALFFVDLAEQAVPHLRGGPDEAGWLDRLEADHDNFRGAIDHLTSVDQHELVVQLTGALWKFWSLRGHYLEHLNRLEAAAASGHVDGIYGVRALVGAAGGAAFLGRFDSAREYAERATTLSETLDDDMTIASARFIKAYVASESGELGLARDLFEPLVEDFHRLGDHHYMLLSMMNLAYAYSRLGDHERKTELRLQIAPVARAVGASRMESAGNVFTALNAADEGRWEEAADLIRQVFDFDDATSDPYTRVMNYINAAGMLAKGREPEAAVRLVSRAAVLVEDHGMVTPWMDEDIERLSHSLRRELGDEVFTTAWEHARNLPYDQLAALTVEAIRSGKNSPSGV